jgi:protein-S-isoprenylcysteine O-methyltransferase Ste14
MYPRRVLALLGIPALLLLARPTPAFFVPGVLVAAAGEGLRIWAAGHLRKNKDVITTGPYAHVRNPLYVGTFLVVLGFLLASSSLEPPGVWVLAIGLPFFLLTFFFYYLPYKCRVETARLERRFDDRARHYNESVPPFLPRLRRYPGPSQRWQPHLIFENSEFGTLCAVFAGIAFLTVKLFVPFP